MMRQVSFDTSTLVRRLGLTRRTFERLVNQSLGVTPGFWLRQEKAVAATFHLLEGKAIKEVSLLLGFKHQTDFCKEFKYWHKVTPSRYQEIGRIRSTPIDELQGKC